MSAGAVTVLFWALLAWLVAAGALVAWKVWGRGMRGLLDDHAGRLSPERLQLLIATLAFGVYYVALAIKNGAGTGEQPTMPDIPIELVAGLLGGSNALYLLGKQWRFHNRPMG